MTKKAIKDLLSRLKIDKNLEKEFLKVDSYEKMNDWQDKLFNYIIEEENNRSYRDIIVESKTEKDYEPDYLFVLMPMDTNAENEDILNTIKEVSNTLEIKAERIDEDEKNERITDRIVENIKRAEYIIAVLNSNKPNVYWEAGYAHAVEKIPIYIAKEGNKIHFDLKDYPIIFYKNYTELKGKLKKRLNALSTKKGNSTVNKK